MRKLFSGFIIQFLVLEIIYRYSIIENMDPNMNEERQMKDMDEEPSYKPEITGGKKKTRKENPVLASWRKFVRKVQHEEKINYPQAMKRASKRKSEWKRGGGGEGEDEEEYVEDDSSLPTIAGGSRRRRVSRKRRASRKRRGSRRR
jgi:hypothetical protein